MINRKVLLKVVFITLMSGIVSVPLFVQPSMGAYFVEPDAYWKLDGADPGTDGVVDEIGAVNGSCTNCPTSETGQVGSGFDFSGGNNEVVFADNAIFDFTAGASFSIELWMKLDGLPGERQVMISRADAANEVQWWVAVNTDGTAVCLFRDTNGPTPSSSLRGVSNVADNNWHHIVAVRDGSADKIMIYVDGVLEGVQDQSANDSTDDSFDSSADVTLGRLTNSSFWYGGMLDEVAIYGSALSSTAVAQHANAAADQSYCNAAPTIDSTAVIAATEGTAYEYTVTATDPETHDITFSLTTFPDGMTINGIDSTSAAIDWTPDEGVTTADVVVLATDQFGATDSQSFTVSVAAVDNAPVITAQATTLETAQNTALTIPLSALSVTDPDNTYPEDFTLQVQPGTSYTVSGATITPDSGFTGDLTVPVTVNDGTNDSNVFNLTVTVTAGSDNGGGGSGGGCFIGSLNF
jgi:hypothetical protein